MAENRREAYVARIAALRVERESWMAHWRDLNKVLLPRSGRFLFPGNPNDGGKKHHSIYDSTGTRAVRTLGAGLQAGMTSPARPWFRLISPTEKMQDVPGVDRWLQAVTRLMQDIYSKSNTYRSLHTMYEELAVYGTAACFVLPDFENVIRLHPLTAGEYMLATDANGTPNSIAREFDMTVAQVVARFVRQSSGKMDWKNVSQTVKNLWERGRGLDTWLQVVHYVEPRADRDVKVKDAKNMPWGSYYFEKGAESDKFLSEGGFKRFPVLAPRWMVSGGDVYGTSPGMEALGDVKQLQHEQLKKAQGLDYQIDPPIQAPASLQEQGIASLPGGVTYHDMTQTTGTVKPLYEVRLDMNGLLADIQDVRGRINSVFYADLFLMMLQDDRSGITAREVAERHEEKLLMLGPVLERLHNELLTPLTDLTFDRIVDAGIVPDPPEELQNTELTVEFVSVLAQAQRAVSLQSVDRLVGAVSSLAAAKQDLTIWDNLDLDELVYNYSSMLGVDPNLLKTKDEVAAARAQRAQEQAAMQQQAAVQQGAQTAKTLSEADTGGDNALSDIMANLTGYSGAM